LTRQAEAQDLLRYLNEVDLILEKFPPLLGVAGQPGYLVITLAQHFSTTTFQGLSVSQREALSRDWRAGNKLLVAHRDYLRDQLRVMRRRTFRERMVLAARSFLREHTAAALLLLLALAALNLALWRTNAESLWQFFSSP
jgi:hypothetical protein